MPGPRSGTASTTSPTDPAPAERTGRRSDVPPLAPAVVDRLEAMRRHLSAARPESGNEALRILRAAFPDVPLAERVEAAGALDRWRRF